MKPEIILTHEFVEYIPNDLKERTIYVSIPFATVAHKCCCGCGNEVVTPLSPTDWKLTFDGESVSLEPSIGNWSFACQSHYWIKRNRVHWAPRWSRKQIDAGRAYDRVVKQKYFDTSQTSTAHDRMESTVGSAPRKSEDGLWRRLKNWWRSHLT